MERITAQLLKQEANRYQHQLQEALDKAEQRRLAEIQKQEAHITLQRERSKEIQDKARDNVFNMLAKKPFTNEEPLTADYYYYESDDGISEEREYRWTFHRDGEVFVVSEITNRTDRGWSTVNASIHENVWLFATDTDRPLRASDAHINVLRDGMPFNLEEFQPGRWDDLEERVENIKEALERTVLYNRIRALMDEYGEREVGSKDDATSKRDVTRLKGVDGNGDVWRLNRNNRSQSEYYTLNWDKPDTMEKFTISITPPNVRPWIHTEYGNKIYDYTTVSDNHLKLLKTGVDVIENNLSLTLFNLEDSYE